MIDFFTAAFQRRNEKKIPSPHSEEDLKKAFLRICQMMAFDSPYDGSRKQRFLLRSFTSQLIGRYIQGTKLREKIDEKNNFLEIPVEYEQEVEILKELTWQFVIKGPSLAAQQHGFGEIIKRLFDIYKNAVISNKTARWGVLPTRNRNDMEQLYQKYGKEIPQPERLRVVADAIAGMSDEQAILIHQRLSGSIPGSVFDPIIR